jgi:hypothetical protein
MSDHPGNREIGEIIDEFVFCFELQSFDSNLKILGVHPSRFSRRTIPRTLCTNIVA